MRLENSPEMSRCRSGGSSPVLKLSTVGKDSSSLTPGSSIPIVAGKKRLPTISWAIVEVMGTSAMPSPGRPARKKRMSIGYLRNCRFVVDSCGQGLLPSVLANGREPHIDNGGARALVLEPAENREMS